MSNTWDTAVEAIELMREHEILPRYGNYAVFIEYINKSNIELVSEFNEFLLNHVRLTDEFCADLFEKHFNPAPSEKIINAGDDLAKEMSQIISDISDVGESTKVFNKKLTRAKTKLDKGNDIKEIKDVVDDLSEATEKMGNNSRDLEIKLTKTTKEIKILRQELEIAKNEAYKDALTGLSNRKAFNNFLEKQVEVANKDAMPLSIIISDIDNFKQINDTWGHLTGDQVITFVASVMQRETPKDAMVCRYGGEEFCMLLPNTKTDEAQELAEKIRANVQNKKLIKRNSGQDLGRVTVSLGVARYRSKETAANFIERCDKALYESKRNGRNMTTLAAPASKVKVS